MELTEGAQKDLAGLQRSDQVQVLLAILELPRRIGRPHEHGGSGIRKVHARGIWEGRAGLRHRAMFGLHGDLVIVQRVLDHDDVERYLKSL